MQDLARIGRVVGFLWKKLALQKGMEESERKWKWQSRPELLAFGSSGVANMMLEVGAADIKSELMDEMLPKVIKQSGFNLLFILEFAHDYGLEMDEVLSLWVRLYLQWPVVDESQTAAVLVSAEGVEVYQKLFCRAYQHKIPAHLGTLKDPVGCLSAVYGEVSPYDYERIGFVLRFLHQHASAQVVRGVFYGGCAPPRWREDRDPSRVYHHVAFVFDVQTRCR